MGLMLESRTSLGHDFLRLDLVEKIPDLPVGWQGHELTFPLTEFFRQTLETYILADRHDRWAHRVRVELANHLLKFWTQRRFPMVGSVRDTGNLPQGFGSLNKSAKSRVTHGKVLSDCTLRLPL